MTTIAQMLEGAPVMAPHELLETLNDVAAEALTEAAANTEALRQALRRAHTKVIDEQKRLSNLGRPCTDLPVAIMAIARARSQVKAAADDLEACLVQLLSNHDGVQA